MCFQGPGHTKEKGEELYSRSTNRFGQSEFAGSDWLLPTTRWPPGTWRQAEPAESSEEPPEPLSGRGKECVCTYVGLGLVYITTHNYEVGFPIQNLLINFLGQNIAINALCKL